MELSDFCFRSEYVRVDGLRIHYIDEGRGETILMLHGNPTWCYLYRNLISDLSRDYRCIALDLPGFGLSDKPAGADYTLRAQAGRIGLFVEKLGLKDITMVGHDIGGIAGLNWAAGHKHLVRRLILLNTRGAVPAVWGIKKYYPPWPYMALWPLRLPVVGELLVQGLNLLQKVVMPIAFHDKGSFGAVARKGFGFPYRGWTEKKAHLATVRQVPVWKSDPVYQLLCETGKALKGWEVPTQIIWGMKDPSFAPPVIDELEKLLPNHYPTLRIQEAGHFLTEEQPAIVAAGIRGFLKSCLIFS